jgi:hypothetical protein
MTRHPACSSRPACASWYRRAQARRVPVSGQRVGKPRSAVAPTAGAAP